MKRLELLQYLTRNGAVILREGGRHTIVECRGLKTQVPRHRVVWMNWRGKFVKI